MTITIKSVDFLRNSTFGYGENVFGVLCEHTNPIGISRGDYVYVKQVGSDTVEESLWLVRRTEVVAILSNDEAYRTRMIIQCIKGLPYGLSIAATIERSKLSNLR